MLISGVCVGGGKPEGLGLVDARIASFGSPFLEGRVNELHRSDAKGEIFDPDPIADPSKALFPETLPECGFSPGSL